MTLGDGDVLVCKPISIHMPHTWHDILLTASRAGVVISIHMPHTWHDVLSARGILVRKDFNPHATYVA